MSHDANMREARRLVKARLAEKARRYQGIVKIGGKVVLVTGAEKSREAAARDARSKAAEYGYAGRAKRDGRALSVTTRIAR